MNVKKIIEVGLAQKQMTNGELAEKLGILPSSLSILKTRKTINSKTLESLADAFEMSLSECVGLAED